MLAMEDSVLSEQRVFGETPDAPKSMPRRPFRAISPGNRTEPPPNAVLQVELKRANHRHRHREHVWSQ